MRALRDNNRRHRFHWRFWGLLFLAIGLGLGVTSDGAAFAQEYLPGRKSSQRPVDPPKRRAAAPKDYKFEGEYGLWVTVSEDSVTVHWITTKVDTGFLQVFRKNKQIHKTTTRPAQFHKAQIKKPRASELRLNYGSIKPDRRYITTIYFEPKPPKAVVSKVDSLFVIGDIHGQFNELTRLLRNAGIIDNSLNWIGGRKQLVCLGDLFDRGDDVTRTLWFLYGLERQAEKAGGRVHVVLGNHELLIFSNDLRYVARKEALIAYSHRTTYPGLFDLRESVLGQWLATKPGLIRIDDILCAHGGIVPYYSRNYSISAFNDSLQKFLHDDLFDDLLADSVFIARTDTALFQRRLLFLHGDDSVFWYRNYVYDDRLGDDLNTVLRKYKSKIHVVAHTPVKTITEFYDGNLIAVDLHDPATEILLLVRKKKRSYERYKVGITGGLTPLTTP